MSVLSLFRRDDESASRSKGAVGMDSTSFVLPGEEGVDLLLSQRRYGTLLARDSSESWDDHTRSCRLAGT